MTWKFKKLYMFGGYLESEKLFNFAFLYHLINH